jgi:hypothetical protein
MFVYVMTIWNNLRPFGIFYGIVFGHLLCSSHRGMFGHRKIWQPCAEVENSGKLVLYARRQISSYPHKTKWGKCGWQ